MKELNKKGVHLHKKQAQPLSIEHEELLWEKEVFTDSSSQGLQNAIYFYTSKIFGLRAADEHSQLDVNQFHFGFDAQGEYVQYKGKVCKNNQGGLATTGRVQFKDIVQYTQPSNPRRYVQLLKKYLQAIPRSGPFYRRPLLTRYDGDLRFSKQKVGVHTFEGLLQKMMKQAGIPGYFTGHSGKVMNIIKIFSLLFKYKSFHIHKFLYHK